LLAKLCEHDGENLYYMRIYEGDGGAISVVMDSIVGEKSFLFAVRVVKLYKYLCEKKREFVLSKQLLRCGTGIGANIREAQQAQSKRDFASKMNIALKEASEAQYWLELLHATEYIDDKQKSSMLMDCVEIIRLLVSILKTTKENLQSD
jgi:four helix bundle protein